MIDRRTLLQGLAASVAVSPSLLSARPVAASDRLRVAVMGVNGRGGALAETFARVPGVSVVELVDVDRRLHEKRAASVAAVGVPAPRLETDYRRTLARKDVDAIVIATPDHWHARATIDGLAAGKHVYVEKPMTLVPAEGEAVLAATRRHADLIVQMGTQRRSSTVYHDLKKRIDAGELGDIYQADTWYINQRKAIGRGAQVAAPPGLDWELWQGPAVRQPYKQVLVHYDWHWTWRYGTGEVGNNAIHELDVARWMMGVGYPERVSAIGGRHFQRDNDWEMYDTMDLHYGYSGGRAIRWAGHSCNRQLIQQRGRGLQLFGTKGSAIIGQDGYELFDAGGKPVGKQAMPDPAPMERGMAYDLLHAANFADAVRGTARPTAPASDANITTTTAHLGNIAWRSGGMIATDPATGRPKDQAAQRLWKAEYADGWAVTAKG